MIDLQAFVQQTLVEVIAAVQGAQGATAGTGAIVNPHGVVGAGRAHHAGRGVEDVHVDVAVTATEDATIKGGVKVYFVTAGAEAREAQAATSRVQFSIPVCWPVGT